MISIESFTISETNLIFLGQGFEVFLHAFQDDFFFGSRKYWQFYWQDKMVKVDLYAYVAFDFKVLKLRFLLGRTNPQSTLLTALWKRLSCSLL